MCVSSARHLRGAHLAELPAEVPGSRGGSAIQYTTRTAHSEARIARGTDYDVGRLDQPWAGLSLSADTHPSALDT